MLERARQTRTGKGRGVIKPPRTSTSQVQVLACPTKYSSLPPSSWLLETSEAGQVIGFTFTIYLLLFLYGAAGRTSSPRLTFWEGRVVLGEGWVYLVSDVVGVDELLSA